MEVMIVEDGVDGLVWVWTFPRAEKEHAVRFELVGKYQTREEAELAAQLRKAEK